MSGKEHSKKPTAVDKAHPMLLDRVINRTNQINAFHDTMDELERKKPFAQTILEWYGIPGIGKTYLTDALYDTYKNKYAMAKISFRELDEHRRLEDYYRDPALIVEDLSRQLGTQKHADLTVLEQEIAQYRTLQPQDVIDKYLGMSSDERMLTKPQWLEAWQRVIQTFKAFVKSLGQVQSDKVQPVVLLFDETDRAKPALIDWIEEWIVSPMTQTQCCLIVWTTLRPWRWRRPEVRRRLNSMQLDVLTPDDVRAQLTQESSQSLAENLFQRVYDVTLGHPFANKVAIAEITAQEQDSDQAVPESAGERDEHLHEQLYKHFIRDYAFRDLKGPDLRTAYELMSMVRFFDTTLLRQILIECGGESFQRYPRDKFGDLLLEMKRAQLLIWTKGHTVEPSLSHVIRNFYRTSRLKTYEQVHRTTLAYYAEWLGKSVDNRNLFVIEELYHLACLREVGDKTPDIEQRFKQRIDDYKDWLYDDLVRAATLERLEGELSKDKELIDLIGKATSDHLNDQLQHLLKGLNQGHLSPS